MMAGPLTLAAARAIALSWHVGIAWRLNGARWARSLTAGFGVVGWGWRA